MNVTLHEKQIEIRLTAAAARALSQRATPLVAEMELLFSCLLRKRVYFGESMDGTTPVNDQLSVRFKPIMTRRCSVSEGGGYAAFGGLPARKSTPLCARLAGDRLSSWRVGGEIRLR